MGLFGSDMDISLYLKLEREMRKDGLESYPKRKKIRLSNNKKHRDFEKEIENFYKGGTIND